LGRHVATCYACGCEVVPQPPMKLSRFGTSTEAMATRIVSGQKGPTTEPHCFAADSLLWDFANRASGAGENRMRTFIFALAAIVPAFAIDRAGAADKLPAFDIARNCREEVVGAITTIEACTKDETDAKNELTKRWSQFGASEKRSCIGEASTGGDKSYVELLTCLEMSSTGHFSIGEDPNR
jgi:hypothetical protein